MGELPCFMRQSVDLSHHWIDMIREPPNNGSIRDQEGNLFEGIADNGVEDSSDGPTTELLDTFNKCAVEEVLVERRVSNQRVACLIHSHVGLGER